MDLGRIARGGYGVEGCECGSVGDGFQVHHVEHGADSGVGCKGLQHQVCVEVLVGVGLILLHGGQEGRELVKGVGLDAAPDLIDGVRLEGKSRHDTWYR